MKYLRNKNTGKQIVYDEKLLELGYYEVVDESQPEEPTVTPPVEAADESVGIQQAVTTLLKRKPKAKPTVE